MFRHSFQSLFAFLLPFAFLFGWAACISLCAEDAARHEHMNVAQINEETGEDCADNRDECTITATPAVSQERQTFKPNAPVKALVSPLTLFVKTSARVILLPEVNQNSPPELSSAPLFLRFRTILI
jgi:hypothetical protein